MSIIQDKILALTKQLQPTGRAFKLAPSGDFEKLYSALGVSEESSYNSAVSILDSILPDNANFTTDDATDWERRLGLLTNSATPLANRKAAILRKLKNPGLNPARQHYQYLEAQLQKAEFDLYVYENRFPVYPSGWTTQTIQQFANLPDNQHGDHQHGDIQHGFEFYDYVANHLDENLDASFVIGSNLRSTFFIGGPTAGSFANVLTSRKEELRHLILQLKPVQTVAYLLINYT